MAEVDPMATRPRVALVTGTLAEPALREVAADLKQHAGVDPVVVVLNIQVAALLTTDWVARKLDPTSLVDPSSGCPVDRVVLPGYTRGDTEALTTAFGVPFEKGPRQLHDLPEHFGRASSRAQGYGGYAIDIIAEINHAPRLTWEQVLAMARAYRDDGADVIDLGCDPQADRPAWRGVGDMVRRLRDDGFRVSIDSFHPDEVRDACRAGAELVLSVNSTNVARACEWGVEVVAIPDQPDDLESLDRTIGMLRDAGVPHRLDPIIEPIGFGFARSLGRYLAVRDRYPETPMMMGVGNLSEMTEVDSAGVNAMLIGFCAEMNVTSVLTTQVINWARASVKELDIARRLMHHAVSRRTTPKHVDSRLVVTRDPKLRPIDPAALEALASSLTDRNVRLFADGERGVLHAMSKGVHAVDADPFVVFDQLGIAEASHAFYLGYEMAKAVTAMTLGKNYVQDEPLRWGAWTRDEVSHHDRRRGGGGLEGEASS